MYSLEVRESVDNIFKKLAKKEPKQMLIINKKIAQIIQNPYHFKPLRAPMKNFRRVHVGNFVIVYSIDEKAKTVVIEDYEHHDKVYL